MEQRQGRHQSGRTGRRSPSGVSLGAGLHGRDNALGLMRLLASLTVIVVHTAPLGGFDLPWLERFGGLAVGVFFLMSGYLIAQSRMRLGWGRFLWHRMLRILPGYWVCLAVTALVIAPLAARIAGEQWQAGSALRYVVVNSTLHVAQPGIESTLSTVAYPGVWNGSLWSLEYELLAYLCAAALLGLALARRRPALVLPLLAAASTVVWPVATALELTGPRVLTGLWLGSFFLTGMALWSLRDRVPLSARLASACAVAVVVLLVVDGSTATALLAAPLAYVLMWAGAVLPVRVGSRTDLSYGIYIYAFPVQQTLATSGVADRLGFLGMLTVSVAIVVPLAWLSWTLVESRALGLKHLRLRPAASPPVPEPASARA